MEIVSDIASCSAHAACNGLIRPLAKITTFPSREKMVIVLKPSFSAVNEDNVASTYHRNGRRGGLQMCSSFFCARELLVPCHAAVGSASSINQTWSYDLNGIFEISIFGLLPPAAPLKIQNLQHSNPKIIENLPSRIFQIPTKSRQELG